MVLILGVKDVMSLLYIPKKIVVYICCTHFFGEELKAKAPPVKVLKIKHVLSSKIRGLEGGNGLSIGNSSL